MTRVPPCRECEVQQKCNAKNARRADPQSQEQRDSNQQFDDSDRITEKDRMRQHDVGQKWAIETYCRASNVLAEIILKAAVGESRSGHLILAEK
jgi:cell fate (sporulation/competence/biofilm development) regulator YlbF (YheA/YmcA/DUF963 family)